MKKLKCLIIYIICFTLSVSAQFYSKRIFTTEHGLPSDFIEDITLGKDGKLWILSSGSVISWDGIEFKEYQHKIDLEGSWDGWDLKTLENGNLLFRSFNKYVEFETKPPHSYRTLNSMSDSSHMVFGSGGEFRGWRLPTLDRFNSKKQAILVERTGVYFFNGDSLTEISSRFGLNNVKFPIKNRDRSLQDNKGYFWFRIDSDFYEFNDGNIKRHDFSFTDIQAVHREKENVYFAVSKNTENGSIGVLYTYNENNGMVDSVIIKDPSSKYAYDDLSLYLYKDTVFVVSGSAGVYAISNGDIKRISHKKGVHFIDFMDNGYVSYYTEGTNTTFQIHEENRKTETIMLENTEVFKALVDLDGSILLASNNGLIQYVKSKTQLVSFSEYLRDDYRNKLHYTNGKVRSLVLDHEGFLWMHTTINETNLQALLRFNLINGEWQEITRAQSFKFLEVRNNPIKKEVFIKYDTEEKQSHILVYKDGQLSPLSGLKSILSANKNLFISSFLFLDSKGRLAFSLMDRESKDEHVYRVEDTQLVKVTPGEVIGVNDQSFVTFDNRTISINDKAVLQLDSGKSIANFSINDNNQILLLATSGFGTTREVNIFYIDYSGKIVKKESKLHQNYPFGECIVFDKNGNFWMSSDSGLVNYRIKNDKLEVEVMGHDEGLISTKINDLKVIDDTTLWIATSRGLNILRLNDFWRNGTISLEVIDKRDGYRNEVWWDTELFEWGNFVFEVDQGQFGIIDRSRILTDKNPPEITNVLVSWAYSYSFSNDVSLAEINWNSEPIEINGYNNQGKIYIEFDAIKLNSSSKMEFSYCLYKNSEKVIDNNSAGDWHPDPVIKLSKLDPGTYNVELYSRIGGNGPISVPKVVTLIVVPNWHQTWWFRSLVIFVVIGLLYLLYRMRVRALKQRQIELEGIVQDRTEEVRKQRDEIHEQNREIKDSISYARRIQEAILPPTKLVKEYLTESFILYLPKDIVAGDFYWFEVKGDDVYFAAADCTGHGVPGAMVSVVCANALKRAVNELNLTQPGKILDKVRELVIETFEKSEQEVKDGMDISFCKLNLKTRKLTFAGAHNPLYRITAISDEVDEKAVKNESHMLIEYKGDKQPIGKHFEEKPFNQTELQLTEGDSIYLFSDGYADQFGGEHNKKFMYKAFKYLLLSLENEPMDKQRELLIEAFNQWKGEEAQVDDVCVIGVRVL